MSQVTVTKVVEGQAHLVIRVDMLSDGLGNTPLSQELVNYPILAPTDLNPPFPNTGPAFRIMQLWYGLVWFDLVFTIGSIDQPNTLWTLARDCDSHVDFRCFGGLLDRAVYDVPPTVDTGILMISTNGFAPVNSQGSLVIELRKTNQVSG